MELIWLSIISHLLICFGLLGIVLRWDNLLITLLSIELAVLGLALLFLSMSFCWDEVSGQIIYVYLLILAGVEAAVGLSLFIVYYRLYGIITTYSMPSARG